MSDLEKSMRAMLGHYPTEFTFHGRMLRIFPLALDEFRKRSKGEWPLEHYSVSGAMSENKQFGAISFIPDPAYSVEGMLFEIPSRGMYKHGMGVTYIYSLVDLVLVNTTYMR